MKIKSEEDKLEQILRGKRIKYIREKELKMNKTQLGKQIGISSQFLGLVEDGKGNLVYSSLKKLRNLSGHSIDYILFGIDDDTLTQTKRFLRKYTELELIKALDTIKDIAILIRNV